MLTRKKTNELKCRQQGNTNSWQLNGTSFIKTKKRYKCRCGKSFTFLHNLRKHLKRKIPCEPSGFMKNVQPIAINNPSICNSINRKPILNKKKQAFTVLKTDSQSKKKQTPYVSHVKLFKALTASCSARKNLSSTKDLACAICKRLFLNSVALKKHVNEHKLWKHHKGQVSCPGCSQLFRSAYHLYLHQQKYKHWSEVMKTRIQICYCPFCGRKFSYIGSRNRHIHRHSKEFPSEVKVFLEETTCECCGHLFLSRHQKTAHKEFCHANTKSFDVRNYKMRRTGNQDVMCNKTEQVNWKANNPLSHPKQYLHSVYGRNLENKYSLWASHKCKWCQKKFSSPYYLLRHIQNFHGSKLKFQCQKCTLKFPTRFQAMQHINTTHRNASVNNLLKEFSKSVKRMTNDTVIEKSKMPFHNDLSKSTDSYFSAHIWKIDDDTSRGIYSCDLCHINSFTKMSSYHRHRKSHLHRRNLLCHKSSFIQPYASDAQNTSNHLVCSVCAQSFNSLAEFVHHRLSYFTAKRTGNSGLIQQSPFKCEICSKTFYHHIKVKSHLLWHLCADKTLFYGTTSEKHMRKTRHQINTKVFATSPHNKIDKHKTECEMSLANEDFRDLSTENPVKKQNFIKDLRCEKCGLQFTDKQHYTAHIKKTCLLISCDYCNRTFFTKQGQARHRRYCKAKYMRKQKCRYCSLDFKSGNDLGWHEKSCQKVHSSERGNYYSRLDAEKLFQCRYCHHTFLNVFICQEHESLHCKEKIAQHLHNTEFKSKEYLTCSVDNQLSLKKTSDDCLRRGINSFSTSTRECLDFVDIQQSSLLSCFQSNKSLGECIEDMKGKRESKYTLVSKSDRCKGNKINSTLFNCPLCKNVIESEHHLLEHLVTHSPFKCSLCGKIEQTVIGFKNHSCLLKEWNISTYPTKKTVKKMVIHKSSDVLLGKTLKHKHVQGKKIKNSNNCEHSESFGQQNEFTNKIINMENCKDVKVQHYVQTLQVLRDNFSQLLYLLIADPELMIQLGWGQKLIDLVLENVLIHMGQQPSYEYDLTELDCLRKNIKILLQLCIKDHVMASVSDSNKLVDDVVIEMLEMCRKDWM